LKEIEQKSQKRRGRMTRPLRFLQQSENIWKKVLTNAGGCGKISRG
jgi:hypothetical protein